MKSTALSIGLALAGVAAVSAAAFVRPPVSPTPKAIATANAAPVPLPATAVAPTLTNANVPNAAPNDVTQAPHARAFAVDVLALTPWGDGPGELGRMRAPESNPEA